MGPYKHTFHIQGVYTSAYDDNHPTPLTIRQQRDLYVQLYRYIHKQARRQPSIQRAFVRPYYHSCSRRHCTFVVHDTLPVYCCTRTGLIHICSHSCDGMEYDVHQDSMRCFVSGRVYNADYSLDNGHNRALQRSSGSECYSSHAVGDVSGVFASATVRGWKRKAMKEAKHDLCVHASRRRALSGINTVSKHAQDTHVVHKSPQRPRESIASRINDQSVRRNILSTWKLFLVETLPSVYSSCINTAYMHVVANSADIGGGALDIYSPSSVIDDAADTRILMWIMRFLWLMWSMSVKTKQYKTLHTLYNPTIHALAILRRMRSGSIQNNRQLIPAITLVKNNWQPIQVTINNVVYTSNKLLRTVTRSDKLFRKISNCFDSRQLEGFHPITETTTATAQTPPGPPRLC